MKAWISGEDLPDAEAASLIVAETILMWKKVLESKFKNEDVKYRSGK